MTKLFSFLVVFLASTAWALDPVSDPSLAVVRIKSHGASGTIISTAQGKSWILSCAHMFFDKHEHIDPAKLHKKLIIDGPQQPYAQPKLSTARVIAADRDYDLSLIEIDNGPFNYIPIAPQGYRANQRVASAGYDSMAWPITVRQATILVNDAGTTYTVEKPWHGRSGGGLIDQRVLIGVVQGYETIGQQRGLYVSHDTILRFMARVQTPRQQPQAYIGFQMSPINYPGGFCPKGG